MQSAKQRNDVEEKKGLFGTKLFSKKFLGALLLVASAK